MESDLTAREQLCDFQNNRTGGTEHDRASRRGGRTGTRGTHRSAKGPAPTSHEGGARTNGERSNEPDRPGQSARGTRAEAPTNRPNKESREEKPPNRCSLRIARAAARCTATRSCHHLIRVRQFVAPREVVALVGRRPRNQHHHHRRSRTSRTGPPDPKRSRRGRRARPRSR